MLTTGGNIFPHNRKGMVPGAEGHISSLVKQQKTDRSDQTKLNPSPSDPFFSRLHLLKMMYLMKGLHSVGTKNSDIWAYVGCFSFKPQHSYFSSGGHCNLFSNVLRKRSIGEELLFK